MSNEGKEKRCVHCEELRADSGGNDLECYECWIIGDSAAAKKFRAECVDAELRERGLG